MMINMMFILLKEWKMKQIIILLLMVVYIVAVKLYRQCVVIWTQRYDSAHYDEEQMGYQ